jgi:hypothetical protein
VSDRRYEQKIAKIAEDLCEKLGAILEDDACWSAV